MTWVLVTLLVGAAVLTGRPGSAARDRLSGPRALIDLSGPRRRVQAVLAGPGGRLVLAATVTAGLLAGAFGGPAGGAVVAGYAGLAVHEWIRRARRKRVALRRAATLDGLAFLVADLRAGIPPLTVAATALTGAGGDGRITRLTEAVWRLAERTGAPAADLIERIEWDARAADRCAKAALAQASGAQTTAVLLAVLPLVGIGMGHAIGANPMAVLLRTPWGAACLIIAMVLQCAGLKWAQRLTEQVAG